VVRSSSRSTRYARVNRLLFIGILSLVQMSRTKLFGGYYLGTGLISVVGTSFATLSTANAVRHVLDRLFFILLTFF
jgi:uric acid-xanthine permease